MGARPRGPVAHLKKAGIQDGDTNLDDENARSAVLLRFLCEQCHAGMSAWIKGALGPTDLLDRIHCNTGTTSAQLVFETRAKRQEFVARFRDVGLPYSVDSPFCNITSAILVRQSRSPEDREIARRFAPLWKVLSQENFFGQDTESPRIVPSIVFRGQVLDMFDRRNGVGVPNSCVASFLLVCLHLLFLTTFCNKWLVKQALRLRIARPMCDGRPFASSPFRRLASQGPFFLAAPSSTTGSHLLLHTPVPE